MNYDNEREIDSILSSIEKEDTNGTPYNRTDVPYSSSGEDIDTLVDYILSDVENAGKKAGMSKAASTPVTDRARFKSAKSADVISPSGQKNTPDGRTAGINPSDGRTAPARGTADNAVFSGNTVSAGKEPHNTSDSHTSADRAALQHTASQHSLTLHAAPRTPASHTSASHNGTTHTHRGLDEATAFFEELKRKSPVKQHSHGENDRAAANKPESPTGSKRTTLSPDKENTEDIGRLSGGGFLSRHNKNEKTAGNGYSPDRSFDRTGATDNSAGNTYNINTERAGTCNENKAAGSFLSGSEERNTSGSEIGLDKTRSFVKASAAYIGDSYEADKSSPAGRTENAVQSGSSPARKLTYYGEKPKHSAGSDDQRTITINTDAQDATRVIDTDGMSGNASSSGTPRSPRNQELDGQLTLPGFEKSDKNAPSKDKSTDEWEREFLKKRKEKTSEFKLEKPAENTEQEEYTPGLTNDEFTDEYRGRADIPAVKMDLVLRGRSLMRKAALTSVLLVLMLVVLFSGALGIASISPDASPRANILITAALLLISVLINARSVFGGLGSALRLKPDLDTPAAVAVLVSCVHCCALLFSGSSPQSPGVFAAPAVVMLILGLFGKHCMIRRIADNFDLLCTDGEKNCIGLIKNERISAELSRGLAIGNADVCIDRKADIPAGFLSASFCEDKADISAQKLSLFAPLVGIIAGGVYMLGGYGAFFDALCTFCAVTLAALPVTSLLSVNLYLKKECRTLRENGGILSSAAVAEDYSNTQVIALDASELFPEGTVQLVNIKSSGTVALDRALLDAAGVSIAAGGPLANVFSSIIGNDKNLLPQVDTLIFEEKMGISGWVSGRRVLIGNRELMDYHGIWVPDADIIRRYESSGISTVFLSDSGQLSAIFFLKYTADEDIASALRAAQDNGLAFSVRSVDPNVDLKLICRVFGLSEHAVRIMSPSSRQAYNAALNEEKTPSGELVHLFDAGSLSFAVSTCKTVHKRVSFFKFLQTLLVIVGALASIVFSLSPDFGALTAGHLLSLQGIWLVITLLCDGML